MGAPVIRPEVTVGVDDDQVDIRRIFTHMNITLLHGAQSQLFLKIFQKFFSSRRSEVPEIHTEAKNPEPPGPWDPLQE